MYNYKIAIVIPFIKLKKKFTVLSNIPNWIFKIICVDDCCPDNSGKFIKENNTDPRVSVVFNTKIWCGWRIIKWFCKS